MSDNTPAENTSKLALAESLSCHRLLTRSMRSAKGARAGSASAARAFYATAAGLGERPVPAYVIDSAGVSVHFPFFWKRPVQNRALQNPEPTMHLEFHQLDQCWEHLRVHPAAQQRRLIASLLKVHNKHQSVGPGQKEPKTGMW